MTDAEAMTLIELMAAQLGEHFDAVQIMASRNEEGLTGCFKRGCGNWYARQGMAHEFINEDVAQENARKLSEVINTDSGGDETEGWKQS